MLTQGVEPEIWSSIYTSSPYTSYGIAVVSIRDYVKATELLEEARKIVNSKLYKAMK